MISYKEGNNRFNYRIVSVCIHNDHILLHKIVVDDFWTLPGGRAELLEYSPDTLYREMKEELDVDVTVGRLLWVSENFFEYAGESFHELSLYYPTSFPPGHKYYQSNEFHGIEGNRRLLFKWHPIPELTDTRLFPTFLRDSLKSLPPHPTHILHKDVGTQN